MWGNNSHEHLFVAADDLLTRFRTLRLFMFFSR